MFASRVASYNDNRLLGTTTTTATAHFGRDNPLFGQIAMLARLRAAHPALTRGRQVVRAAQATPGLLAVSRFDPGTGAEVLIALNTSTAPVAAQVQVEPRLLACLRGNIFLYYGEELSLTQVDIAYEDLRDPEAIANWPLTLSRDGARTPMPWAADAPALGFSTARPWLPTGPDHAALAVDRQLGDPASVLAWTREVLACRKAHKALTTGTIDLVAVEPRVLAFERAVDGEHLLCVFNLSAEAQLWSPRQPDHWRVLLRTGGATLAALPPYSGFVAQGSGSR